MRRASDPIDVLSRLPREARAERLFIVFTLAEAQAMAQLQAGTDPAALRGLAKIRTAVHAAPAETPPRRRRRRPAPIARTTPPITTDTYVPWRDEADGIYR